MCPQKDILYERNFFLRFTQVSTMRYMKTLFLLMTAVHRMYTLL